MPTHRSKSNFVFSKYGRLSFIAEAFSYFTLHDMVCLKCRVFTVN